MSNKKLGCLGFVACIVLLTGCGRLIDWGKSRLYQGDSFKINSAKVDSYMRWVTVYDQFTTVAMFDALWLSGPVRTAFAQEHAFKEEKTDEHYKAALRRQLEEPNHFIAFYVLSLHEVVLGDPASEWSVFLLVDDYKLDPIEIKGVDLPYEYQMFFGKRLTLFKDAYSIKFSAKNSDDKPYITPETKSIRLFFRKFDKEVILTWNLDQQGFVIQERVSGGVPVLESREELIKNSYEAGADE